MTSEYKIDKDKFLKPIKNSKWFYVFLIIGLVVNWYFFDLMGIVIVFAIFGIFIIFQIILHFQYYHHDKKIILIVDYGNRLIQFNNATQNIDIKFDDIEVIQRFKGSKYPGPFDSFMIPSNFYHWTRIQTKNGFQFSFSDFIKDDLNIFGIRRQEKIRTFLNTINK